MHRPFDVAQRRASRTNARHRRVRGAAGHIEKNLTHSMLAVHAVCSGCGALLSLSETLDAVGDLRSFVAFVRKLCDRQGEGLAVSSSCVRGRRTTLHSTVLNAETT